MKASKRVGWMVEFSRKRRESSFKHLNLHMLVLAISFCKSFSCLIF